MKTNFLFILPFLVLPAVLSGQSDFDLVKQRVFSEILASSASVETVTGLLETIKRRESHQHLTN